MKCRDLRVLSFCSPIAKKLADESQEETENRDSSSDLAEINGEIKSIDSFLALFVDSDAAFLPVVQQQAAVSFRLNKPKGGKKKNQTVIEESQDEFEDYYEQINQRIAQGGLKSNKEGKNILIPVPLLLATTKENWALFRDKMTELGHQVTVVPYSAKEAIAMGYLSQRLKNVGISYGDVHNNEHKYYLQILATIIMNSQGTPDGGDEKSIWFIPKWLLSDKFLKFSKDLGIDLSKYNLMSMLTKENGMPRVIVKPPIYRYNSSRGRE